MIRLCAPAWCVCMMETTSAASSSGRITRIFPSLAIYRGSSPITSQAPLTPSLTGKRSSLSRIPVSEERQISFSALATPPRVGSLNTWIPGLSRKTSSIMSLSARVSLLIFDSKASSSRSDIMAIPWSPMVPLMITASPLLQRRGAMFRPGRMRPMPVVLINSLSPFPFSTTLVSPVTI